MRIKVGQLRRIIKEEIEASRSGSEDLREFSIKSAFDTAKKSVTQGMNPIVVSAIKDLAKYLAEWDFYYNHSYAKEARKDTTRYSDVQAKGKLAVAALGNVDGKNAESHISAKTQELEEKLTEFYKAEGGLPAFNEKAWRLDIKWEPDFKKADSIKNMAAEAGSAWKAEHKAATAFMDAVQSGSPPPKTLPYHVAALKGFDEYRKKAERDDERRDNEKKSLDRAHKAQYGDKHKQPQGYGDKYSRDKDDA